MNKRIQQFISVTGLILLTLLFFHQLAFTDLILARGDTYNYFYPYWDARNTALSAGQLPLWNPDIFMGIPLLANPQIGIYYPLNWLLIPFTAPDAIRYSILLHIALAATGTFYFFRMAIHRSPVAAMVAAMVFALGGYMGAHVEQINQLQGLAWLPWLFLCLHLAMTHPRYGRYLLLMAMVWALQILSGHTQTVFISGIALGLYVLFSAHDDTLITLSKLKYLTMIAGSAIITILLAIPQLLPTLELTGMSNRGSGLTANQATAFSLPPTYLARALLPSYDGLLFSEYIGYIGVIALALALLAIVQVHQDKASLVWLIFAGIGIIFAVGRYTDIYLNIAQLPGFDLFRVPARWLALYAFGMAMLAGRGVVILQEQRISTLSKAGILSVLLFVIALGRILPVLQVDIVGSAQPTLTTIGLWLVALAISAFLFFVPFRQYKGSILLSAIGVELFLASLIMPFNNLTPRDVYDGQRFTISQMLVLSDEIAPPRLLAISTKLFNPGDVDVLRARYQQSGLDENAQQIAFTAIKSQEIVSPNLNITWGIPGIDGYGGGVLPTIYYSQFTSLLLPDNILRTTDGRIGETIARADCRGACVPDPVWLQWTHTGYIIADKNFDVSHNSIFFDTSLDEFWSQNPAQPDFPFDEVQVLFETQPDIIESQSFEFQGSAYYLAATNWETFEQILRTQSDIVLGASVVNTRTQTFLQLTPAGFERVLSSDIKIYQLTGSSRVQFAETITTTPDDWNGHEAALDILEQSPETLVVHDAPLLDGATGRAEITRYEDTRIEISVNSSAETYLYIADAYYPGWRATVNGEPETVYRANVMFRSVRIPQGESTVIMEFVPQLWYQAGYAGVAGWIVVSVLLGGLFLRKEDQTTTQGDYQHA